ncbi:Aste57867_24861 [Aphanomyces stellatus]|uniref:Aste57867_24861 protein n=1 Tax=Aphanomyces stellatus TaxID=120398 RepID=A0A485LRK1_9STRA|nr:hypothetical protein As57867_024783 [Aphanomyces stellatus]VFU01495.1 Aste57867_24861 [Aphanomyces stellatus]
MSNAADETRQASNVLRRLSSVKARIFQRKVAVLPNSKDVRVLQSQSLLALMSSKFSTKNLLRRRPLCATDGNFTWLLASGFIGSQTGADTVVPVEGLAPRHAQITYKGDAYFIQSCGNAQTFLQLPFDVGRKGYPLSRGDVIEMGPAFIVTVLDIEVRSTTTVEQAPAAKPRVAHEKVQFDQATDIRTQVCLRNLAQKTKLSKSVTAFEPAKLVLQLRRTLPSESTRIVTSPKSALWFGSLHSADIVSTTLDRLHAKIEFDGAGYILRDFSNATRVLIGTTPVHIVPDDVLVMGDKVLKISEYCDDVVSTPGLDIQTLRMTVRKNSHMHKHVAIKLELPRNKLLHVGRSPQCNITLSNYTMKLVQFSILYENDRCWVMPLNGTLNQGLYRLLHRTEQMQMDTVNDVPVQLVSTVSPTVEIQTDMVFKIGCSEIEVVFVKQQPKSVTSKMLDHLNDRYTLLQSLPWFLLSPNLPCFFTETGNLAAHCKVEVIPAGEYIYGEGDDATRTYIVIQGSVLLFRAKGILTPNPLMPETATERCYIESVERGGSFGEISILKPNAKHTTNALARCDIVCMVIAAKDWADYCSPYRDLYHLPLQHGLHETTLTQALSDLPGMDLIAPALITRVALKMTRMSFPPQTLIHEHPCAIFFISDGTVEFLFSDGGTECQSKPFCFDRQTHCVESLVSIKAVDYVDCLVLSPEDYENTIGMTLKHRRVEHPLAFITAFDTTPQHASPTSLPKHRTASSIAAAKLPKRKSSLIRAKELWTGVATEDEDSEEERAGPGRRKSTVSRSSSSSASQESWRAKKRNATMLESRLEYLKLEPTIESAVVLYVLAGPNRGDVHVVRNTLTIGNTHGPATMKLRDKAVSPLHAMIFHRNGKYYLQDSGSTKGTFVRLEDDEACCLHVGDKLLAGDTEFTIVGNPLLPPVGKRASCSVS